MLGATLDSLLSVVFPVRCLSCDAAVESAAFGHACGRCWQRTKILSQGTLLCDKCGDTSFHKGSLTHAVCTQCDGYAYDKARSAAIYEWAVRASVIRLKTDQHPARRTRDLISTEFEASGLGPHDIIIPVPLAPQRKLERGFNQAEIIAAQIAKIDRTPIDTLSLSRTVHTPIHRAGMDRKARERTVEKAFAVTRPNRVKGRRVLLVDDVLTSGATAAACAAVLKKSGAAAVNVFTLARAAKLF